MSEPIEIDVAIKAKVYPPDDHHLFMCTYAGEATNEETGETIEIDTLGWDGTGSPLVRFKGDGTDVVFDWQAILNAAQRAKDQQQEQPVILTDEALAAIREILDELRHWSSSYVQVQEDGTEVPIVDLFRNRLRDSGIPL